jgi:NAD(P)-dependent dehydrogenase (short-subunit alcohol dehydrogenase family)
LKGARIVVTGASRGIGRAIALEAARSGALVVAHFGKSGAAARDLEREILDTGGRVVLAQGDWADPEAVKRVIGLAWEAFGGLDALVNNAGISMKKHMLDTSDEDLERLWRVNVRGTFVATREVARRMLEAGIRGRILTITSVNGLRPNAGLCAYSSTKGALEMMMKAVALELSPHGILVNTMAVGAVDTDITRDVSENPETLRAVNAGIPLHRMGNPDEIGVVACLLLRGDNSYMTGSTVTVDGGLLLNRGYGNPKPYGN